jgi:hypothetical protein
MSNTIPTKNYNRWATRSVSYCVSLRYEFRVVMSVAISAWKRFSGRFYLQLFVGGACLIYVICVWLCIVVSTHIGLCFCFVFFLCTLYYQFLWIAYIWLPHWYSLAFIYTNSAMFPPAIEKKIKYWGILFANNMLVRSIILFVKGTTIYVFIIGLNTIV